jgi:hypothetical protein
MPGLAQRTPLKANFVEHQAKRRQRGLSDARGRPEHTAHSIHRK